MNSRFSRSSIFKISVFLSCFVACAGVGIIRLAKAQSGPAISNVTIARRSDGVFQATVTGTGFVKGKGGSVVEINRIAANKTKPINKGALPDGTPTQLRVTDGKLESINTSGDQALFQVLNTSSGQRSAPFVVNPNAKPSLSGIQNAAGKVGTTVNTIIEGRNLFGGSVTISGGGVTATVISNPSTTQLPVTMVIAADASPGPRIVTVTTPGGTAQNDNVRFVVTAPDETKPVVSSIFPSRGTQGKTVSAGMAGFRLNGATQVSLSGSGVTATIQSGGTETSLPVSLAIAADAAPGPRTVTVTTPNGTSSENVTFTVDQGAPPPVQLQLTKFCEVPDKTPDIYHMTQVPDGSYAATQYTTRSLVLISPTGTVTTIQRNSFLLVSSLSFYSTEVGYTTCVPGILASRSFRASDFGREGIPPGNLGGVSNPHYMVGVDGLVSRTFFLSNDGTGEIRLIEPDKTSTSTVVSSGFTITPASDVDARGLEQLAYDKSTKTIFALDSGKGTLVAVDQNSGSQKVLRSGFDYPFGLVLMPNGNLLVSDRGKGTLIEVSTGGLLVATYDTKQGPNALRGLFVDSKGNIFLLVDKIQTIFRVSFVLIAPGFGGAR